MIINIHLLDLYEECDKSYNISEDIRRIPVNTNITAMSLSCLYKANTFRERFISRVKNFIVEKKNYRKEYKMFGRYEVYTGMRKSYFGKQTLKHVN